MAQTNSEQVLERRRAELFIRRVLAKTYPHVQRQAGDANPDAASRAGAQRLLRLLDLAMKDLGVEPSPVDDEDDIEVPRAYQDDEGDGTRPLNEEEQAVLAAAADALSEAQQKILALRAEVARLSAELENLDPGGTASG